MDIREYGNAHKKDLLLFPGSCEPWQEFAGAAEEYAAKALVFFEEEQ